MSCRETTSHANLLLWMPWNHSIFLTICKCRCHSNLRFITNPLFSILILIRQRERISRQHMDRLLLCRKSWKTSDMMQIQQCMSLKRSHRLDPPETLHSVFFLRCFIEEPKWSLEFVQRSHKIYFSFILLNVGIFPDFLPWIFFLLICEPLWTAEWHLRCHFEVQFWSNEVTSIIGFLWHH